MSKFYEVSKVLDKRTDAHGRVQYLVRWRGYGKKNDSWVDEADTNERLMSIFVMNVAVLCNIIFVDQKEVKENEISSKTKLIHLDFASSWWQMLKQLPEMSSC